MVSPPPIDFGGLVRSLGEATAEMEGLKVQLAGANRRSAAAKNVAVIGIVAAVVGLAIGAGGLVYADKAQDTADDVARIQDERRAEQADARVSSCIQQNVTTERTRKALIDGVSILANGGEASPRAEEFVAAYTARVERALGYRDCTPAGIAAYFDKPPGDPAKEG